MDHGTIYAWSDRLEGPYREFKDDNVLIADPNGAAAGISCRSVRFQGKTYVLYTERFPDAPHVLSPPMEVAVNQRGQLRLAYSGYAERLRGEQKISPDAAPRIKNLPIPSDPWPLLSGTWTVDRNVLIGRAEKGWQIGYLGAGGVNVERNENANLVKELVRYTQASGQRPVCPFRRQAQRPRQPHHRRRTGGDRNMQRHLFGLALLGVLASAIWATAAARDQIILKNDHVLRELQIDGQVWRTVRFARADGGDGGVLAVR